MASTKSKASIAGGSDEAERRLNSYQSRIGGAFQFAEELGAKRMQLREIEGELAASAFAEADQMAA